MKSAKGKKLLKLLATRNSVKEKISHVRDLIIEGKPSCNDLNQPPKKEFKLQFLSEYEKDFLSDMAPELPSLIKDENGDVFIPKGIVAALIGAGGVGKTHWCTQLAMAIVLGKTFLGKYNPQEKGHVALIVGENTDDDIHRVLRKTVLGLEDISSKELKEASKRLLVNSVTGLDASFTDRNGNQTTFYKKLLKGLIEKEPEAGWDLIIIDPASRFLGPNAEIDNAAATAFITLLESIIQNTKGKPTVLYAHHMSKNAIVSGKADSTASRGASGLTDGVRLQINLNQEDKNKNEITMSVTKSNHTAIPEDQIISKGFNGHLKISTQSKLRVDKDGKKPNIMSHKNKVIYNRTINHKSTFR